MSTPDPDELLRQLDPGLVELKARAEQAQDVIATSSSTTRAPDGSISVTVGPGGNLTGLQLTERAYQQPPDRLAAQIMRLAGQAQQEVGAQVVAAFGGLVGADSPAMSVLSEFLPPEPDEAAAQGDEPPDKFTPPDEPDPHQAPPPMPPGPPSGGAPQPPAPQPPSPPQPQRRARRTRGSNDEVEPDYDQGDIWS